MPALVAAAMLLVALAINGAFAISQWAPISLFVLVVIVFARRRRLTGAPLVAAGALWALAAWSLASALWGESPESAIATGSRLLLYAGLFTLPLVTLHERVAAQRVAATALAGLGLVVGLSFAFVLADGPSVFLAGRLNDPVAYRNGTAALFVIAFWPLLCAAAAKRVPASVRAAAFAFALLALGLGFLTQSRGALVGFAAGGAVAIALGPDRVRRAWFAIVAVGAIAIASGALLAPYDAFTAGDPVTSAVIGHAGRALVVLALVALVAVLVVAVYDSGLRSEGPLQRSLRKFAAAGLGVVALVAVVGGLAVVGNPVTFVQGKVDEFKMLEVAAPGETRLGSTGGPRYDIWRIAVSEFRQAPVAGVGAGSYRFGYYAERTTDRNLSSPHSLPLALLAETGLVGALLFVLFLGAVAVTFATRWRAASPDTRRWTSASAAAGMVLIGQCFVDWLWQIPGLAGLGVLALGLSAALVSLPERAESDEQPRLSVRALSAAALAVAVVVTAGVYLSDFHTRQARVAGAGSAEGQLSAARTAARLNPVALAPRMLQAGALEELGRVGEARAVLADARRLEPGNFVVHGLIGDLEVRAGNTAAARRAYRRALKLNPGDVGLRKLAAMPR